MWFYVGTCLHLFAIHPEDEMLGACNFALAEEPEGDGSKLWCTIYSGSLNKTFKILKENDIGGMNISLYFSLSSFSLFLSLSLSLFSLFLSFFLFFSYYFFLSLFTYHLI